MSWNIWYIPSEIFWIYLTNVWALETFESITSFDFFVDKSSLSKLVPWVSGRERILVEKVWNQQYWETITFACMSNDALLIPSSPFLWSFQLFVSFKYQWKQIKQVHFACSSPVSKWFIALNKERNGLSSHLMQMKVLWAFSATASLFAQI